MKRNRIRFGIAALATLMLTACTGSPQQLVPSESDAAPAPIETTLAPTPTPEPSVDAASACTSGGPGYTTPLDLANFPEAYAAIEFGLDVRDLTALADWASDIFCGTVTGVVQTNMTAFGGQSTVYSVRVDHAFKGELQPGEVVEVLLPGGFMKRGDQIAQLEADGEYDDWYPPGASERKYGPDPKTLDQEEIIGENWGVNPASKSLIEELQPEAWIFLVDKYEDGYSGFANSNSLMYLKDGLVHGLYDPVPAGATEFDSRDADYGFEPFPLSELEAVSPEVIRNSF